jgi:transcriptional regulator of arginine metabolism
MKQQRQTAIRDVLNQASVPSQDELRRRLARRGFHVTQATLSRDIHELRLSKGPALTTKTGRRWWAPSPATTRS